MWIRGEMPLSEAISEIVKCAVEKAIEKQVNGMVYVEVNNDGSYLFESPEAEIEENE